MGVSTQGGAAMELKNKLPANPRGMVDTLAKVAVENHPFMVWHVIILALGHCWRVDQIAEAMGWTGEEVMQVIVKGEVK
jgi:hypothetical protein